MSYYPKVKLIYLEVNGQTASNIPFRCLDLLEFNFGTQDFGKVLRPHTHMSPPNTKNHKDHPNHKCRYTYFDVQHKSVLSAKPPSVVESLLMSAISR